MTTNRSLYCEAGTFHYEPKEKRSYKKGARRAAAYCRVSTLAEEQELSFETQSVYYKNLIENDPSLELVGIYGDQGFSGLQSAKRKEFQRLIADCEAGKVDVILVKSISRFSRNSIECLEYIRRLKQHNVTVLFEKEGLNSMDSQTEMILSIYASMAQSESCSHSENVRWAKQRRAEMGDPIRITPYGYRSKKKAGAGFRDWIIKEDEAETIRYIFSLAYQGYATTEIQRKLNESGLLADGRKWSLERIRTALNNEAYRGDILTNKSVVLDYLSKKCITNRGQVEQYYIEQHHEPIVSPDIFDTVHEYFKHGFLNSRNTRLRAAWFEEHPEIMQRREENMQ